MLLFMPDIGLVAGIVIAYDPPDVLCHVGPEVLSADYKIGLLPTRVPCQRRVTCFLH